MTVEKMKMRSFVLASMGMALLSLTATSCRDFGIDNGRSALMCAASSVTTVNGAELNLMDPAYNGRQLAQSFKPQSTVKNVQSVILALQRKTLNNISSISGGSLMVTLVADKNGLPDLQSQLGMAAIVPVSKVSNFPQTLTFTFGQPIAQLTAKTSYWIVLDGTFAWSANDHIAWLGSDSGSYSDGQALVNSGGTWANPDAFAPNPVNQRSLAFQAGCL